MKKDQKITETPKDRTVEDALSAAFHETLRAEVKRVSETLGAAGPILSPRLLRESAERLATVARLADSFPSVFGNGNGAVTIASEPPAVVLPEKKTGSYEPKTSAKETLTLGRKVLQLRETKTWKKTAAALRISEARASYAMRAARAHDSVTA